MSHNLSSSEEMRRARRDLLDGTRPTTTSVFSCLLSTVYCTHRPSHRTITPSPPVKNASALSDPKRLPSTNLL
ncbi:hypothetical protein BC629DRAFT_1532040 [Irpex lacteus]|nr:hypothetical protein BC629DRAFT_1532040 [Irpex lacteus]